MPKISIIVPVYNVENYLEKCLDSLVNQTLTDIEIILVDDGSTDNSSKILDSYRNIYNNIQVISKKNGGMSDARNVGLTHATGEYISFVDSDDYIEKDMLEKLYTKAKEKDYDIVFCNINIVYPDKTILRKAELQEDTPILTLEDKKQLLLNCYPVVWNKIYKKSFLDACIYENDGLFKKGLWFEDVRMLYKMIPSISSAAIINDPLYHYIQRPKSITYTYSNRLYDVITNMDNIIEYYKDAKLYSDYSSELEYMYVSYLFATFIKRLSKCKNIKTFNEGYDFVIRKVNSTFPNYKQNKYISLKNPKSLYLRYFNKLLANLIYISERNKLN